MPYATLYAATKHAVEGYSESLEHELSTWGHPGIGHRACIHEDGVRHELPGADSKLDEYHEIRASLRKTLTEVMATAYDPSVVANVVLDAGSAARPKLRYTASVLAGHQRLLRRFALSGLFDTAIRKDLPLDALTGWR